MGSKYRVVWCNRASPKIEHRGKPVDKAAAQHAVKTMNAKHPHLLHWIELVPEDET